MNVCFVSFEFPPKILGGAGTYAELLVKSLRNRGAHVYVVAGGNQNACEHDVCRLQVSEKAYLRQLLFMNAAAKKLQTLCKEHKFDLVHFNEPHILRKRPEKLPTVSTFHSSQLNEIRTMLKFAGSTLTTKEGLLDLTVRSPVGYVGDLLTGHKSNLIISPSQNLSNLLATQCFIDKQRIRFIPNAVDLKQLDQTKADDMMLKKHDLHDQEYLLFMGRLSATKGLEYLVEAFRAVKKRKNRMQNLKLVIAGTGSYQHSLERQTKNIDGVVFTGFIDTVEAKKALYAHCLAVVLPSLYEAFPMVLLEAMAMKKPVIASSVGDIPLIIEDGVDGFLVEPKNAESLASSIETLYENPKLCEKMGNKGRLKVESHYAPELLAERTMNAYEEAI